MNWEKIYERLRYTGTVIWMNSFGLIIEIIVLIRTNKKVMNYITKEENIEELRVAVAKLMIFIGVVSLALCLFWMFSQTFLIISLALIGLGVLGMLANGVKVFLDELFGY